MRLEPAKLIPPAVVGLLRNPQLERHLRPVSTLGQQPIRLLQLSHHLLWGAPLRRRVDIHRAFLPATTGRKTLTKPWTDHRGSGHKTRCSMRSPPRATPPVATNPAATLLAPPVIIIASRTFARSRVGVSFFAGRRVPHPAHPTRPATSYSSR